MKYELGEPEHVVATAWVLQHPAVASAIVGVRTFAQLAGLDRAAEFDINGAQNRSRPLSGGTLVVSRPRGAAGCLGLAR
jgi:aryl-alcohol dehydrogenase-like predicted oxidoreductase